MSGSSQQKAAGSIREGGVDRGPRTRRTLRGGRSPGSPGTPTDGRPAADPRWAKPRDDENESVVVALREVFCRAHSLGVTDLDIAEMLSRRGRVLGVWTVRAWRESHRANTMSAADMLRLVGALDEWAVRPLIDLLVASAGMVATDLPELSPGRVSVEAGALRVGVEVGELQGVVVAAAEDGEISAQELAEIAAEAGDVVREAAYLGASAGGGK